MYSREPMPGELIIDQSTGDRCLVICVNRDVVWARNLTDPARKRKPIPLPLADCEVMDGGSDLDEAEPAGW